MNKKQYCLPLALVLVTFLSSSKVPPPPQPGIFVIQLACLEIKGLCNKDLFV